MDALRIALHPVRKKILTNLATSKGYASKLAERLHLNTKLIQFHLSTLQRYGLVRTEYGLVESPSLGRPVAVRFFALTNLGTNFVDIIDQLPSTFGSERARKEIFRPPKTT